MLERRDNYKLSLTSEEAAEWFVRLKDEPRTTDRRKYLRWLRASPENTAEALRMGQLFRLLQDCDLKHADTTEDSASNVVELSPRERNAPAALHAQTALPAATNTRAWRIAAGFAVLAVSTLVLLVLKAAWIDRTIQTEASEWQTQVLSDGSIVNVGPRTELRMEFGDNRRFVHLARGEALFQVAKDPTRPFVVSTALASIRAVGTQFGVTRVDGKTVVTVQEGVVAVSQRDLKTMRTGTGPGTDAEEPQTVTLTAGEQVTLSGSWPVEARKVDAERELAWAQRLLIFDNVTVAEAVNAFNRRNRMQIQVVDPAISARTVDGVFNAADPESFAQFLSFVEPVTITVDSQRRSLRIQSVAPAGERQTSAPAAESPSAFGTLR